MKTPIICLNCIFKNESAVVLRLLQSVYKFINCYCIVDTGSTDNTIEIIRNFFQEHKIPGKIVCEPFVDFGTTRTFALNQCTSENWNVSDIVPPDFILLLDADMIFQLPPENVGEFKERLWSADAHYIFQGSDRFYHKNVRVIRNNIGCTYVAPTHEYISTPEGSRYNQFARDLVFIRDIGDGGCKSDKFERDVRLLTADLRKNPKNVRSWFYLANSLGDLRQYDRAIDAYKNRIELGGWWEEVWYSQYKIGIYLKCLGRAEEAVMAWIEAYELNPNRIENLFEIIHHYRNIGKNKLAYAFYVIADAARERTPCPDFLFVNKEIYDWRLDYEMTIIGYYCNFDGYKLREICMNVLNYHGGIDQHISQNILSNYKFYAAKLNNSTSFVHKVTGTDLTADVTDVSIDRGEFVSSTPSFVRMGDRLYMNTRFVNYRIGEHGEYINRANITTINVITVFQIGCIGADGASAKLTKIDEYELPYDKTIDNIYVGIEDVRLFATNSGELLYNGNRGLDMGHIMVEHGHVPLDKSQTVTTSRLISYSSGGAAGNMVEKNWVMFQDAHKHIKYIYGWSPLVIGYVRGDGTLPVDIFHKTREIKTPPVFRHFRGSTNGCRVGNEIWFICHIVSYESRRYYYHAFVVLDATSCELKRYTTFFTFEGEPVEYCLGLEYFEESDRLLLGYSTMDKTTKFMYLDRSGIIASENDAFSWVGV